MDEININTQREFDRICSEFEDSWTVDSYQLILDLVSEFDHPNRTRLANMLIELDIEFRKGNGQPIDTALYASVVKPGNDRVGTNAGNESATIFSEGPPKFSEGPPKPISSPDQILNSQPSDPLSNMIGPYKLLQQIGEGGMGVVWLAEQQEPVRRRVAIKLVRQAFGSKEIIARFEAERQALAMMDHDNIAKILDAGTTASGSPFFVMELVHGMPITEYCDSMKLSINERLRLFLPICDAVQHAHRKGIIHRDLKPGNILVTTKADIPIPKVIDFGLAKAVEHTTKLTDKTVFTEFGKVVGTLQYMSPEQAEINALDIDTRADVYSLGAILYQLLVGSTPLEKDTLANKSLIHLLEYIRENEPPRPSVRLAKVEASANEIFKNRATEPGRLKRALQYDLDWVIMKAIEKNRSDRYESAMALGSDIENYLNKVPLAARPPSLRYRLRKYIAKNRKSLISTAIITTLIATTIAVIVYALATDYWKKQELAEKEAREAILQKQVKMKTQDVQREAERARLAEQLAIRQKNISDKVRHFLQIDLLSQADVYQQANYSDSEVKLDITLLDALNRAAVEYSPETIEETFPGQADVQAEILVTIARIFSGLDEHAKALQFSIAGIRTLEKSDPAPIPPKVLQARTNHFFFLLRAKRHIDSIAVFAALLEDFDRMLGLEKQDFADNLSDEQLRQEINDRVDIVFETIIKWGDPKNGSLPQYSFDENPTWVQSAQIAAHFAKVVGHLQSIETQIIDRYGLDDPRTGYTLTATASVHFAISEIKASMGAKLESIANLFSGEFGKLETALQKYQIANDILQRTLDEKNMLHAGINMLMGVARERRGQEGDIEKALMHFELCHEILGQNLRQDHPALLNVQGILAQMYLDIEQYRQAVPLLRRLLTERTKFLGADHIQTDNTRYQLAQALAFADFENAEENRAARDEAIENFGQSLEYAIAQYTTNHEETSIVASEFGHALMRFGKWNDAAEKFEIACQYKDSGILQTLTNMSWQAHCLKKSKDYAQAAVILKQVCSLRYQQHQNYQYPMVIADHLRLAIAYQEMGKNDELENTLSMIDRTKIGDGEFKSENDLRLTVAEVNHLQALGWVVNDFDINIVDEKVFVDRSYQVGTNLEYRLPKNIQPTELENHLKAYRSQNYKLVKKVTYSFNGQDFFATLWHRPSPSE